MLTILFWVILVLSVIAYLAFHLAYVFPAAVLALFIIVGLKVFRTPIQ